jgi:hypothetical protein
MKRTAGPTVGVLALLAASAAGAGRTRGAARLLRLPGADAE